MSESLLNDLTPAQREAVTHVYGPMLVVAGAGSGKTRVVTRRVAHLIASGIRPWRILALTFTNKAAKEMRSRVEALVGQAPAWMGTFHSVCARFLRMDLHLLDCGRDRRFSIMDQADQESLVKHALKKFGLSDKANKPSSILAAISNAKSGLISPTEFVPSSWRDEIIGNVYTEYEASLRAANSVDFDDLLVLAVKLLQNDKATLERYRLRFPFLLVDEYQDTNRVQYLLLKLLAGESANLHATGDPDQSIYSWRGADYRNIMDFRQDFPGAKVVRLEQNYRSTKTILAAANRLIKNNSHRIEKDLFTDNPDGEKIHSAALQTEAMEAAWIAEEIEKLKRAGRSYGNIAVFYRTNAQSRPLEEAFMRASIPYQLVGGIRFYERREVKDLLAHLKIRVNPQDLTSLRRIVNCRATGVGEKTLAKIAAAASEANQPILTFLADPNFSIIFKPNKKTYLFSQWCQKLAAIDTTRADQAVKEIVDISGLIEELLLDSDKDERADDRIDNLHSLSMRAADFVRFRLALGGAVTADRTGNGELSESEDSEILDATPAGYDLAAFLEDVALVADVDTLQEGGDKATLMTLHSAKGLEFPFVFLSGLEEGLLPHKNATNDQAVEEERRLFYVGLTRARQQAWLSRGEWRFAYGSSDYAAPSRFLQELPVDAVVELDYADPLSEAPGSGFVPKRFAPAAGSPAFDLDDMWDDDAFSEMDDVDPGFMDDEPVAVPRLRKPFTAVRTLTGSLQVGKKSGNSSFQAGDLVRHPDFGSGKVFSINRNKILVQFFASGMKMLLLDQCRLTKE